MTPVEQFCQGKWVVAATGASRYDPEPVIVAQLEAFLAERDRHHDMVVICGGALGWDRCVARMAYDLHIPFGLVIPNESYGSYYWGKAGLFLHYQKMVSCAAAVEYTNPSYLGRNGVPGHANFDRNARLVELADEFVVFEKNTPGTRDCVRRIREARTPYTIFRNVEDPDSNELSFLKELFT